MSTRRRTAPAIDKSQSTLAFHGRLSKITKPSNTTPSNKPVDEAKASSEIASDKRKGPKSAALPNRNDDAAVVVPTTGDVVTEDAHLDLHVNEEKYESESEDEGDEAREQAEMAALRKVAENARKMSQKHIKSYWKRKEDSRKAPRVHQKDLTIHESILREWDMTGHFGPCMGITRERRWYRANNLGLNPPLEVLAVLLQEQNTEMAKKAQVAHVDELMSSRFIET